MASLRDLHRAHQPLISPLAHDALSARLIERTGFKTFNIGGSALLAARYALPDLGLAGFAEMLAGIRDIVEASKLPCLVDADDGYGDVKSVVRTIQGSEAAAAEQTAKDLFLTLLARYSHQGRNVSHKGRSHNYAPRIFADEPEAKALARPPKALAEAMEHLFRESKIHVEMYNRFDHERIAIGAKP